MRGEGNLTTPKQTMSKILAQTIKVGIITSNLIPLFAGLTLALYTYQISIFEKFPKIIFALIGSIFVMGAAGAFNNLYDRDIDSIMERTKNRPTVTEEIKPKAVLWLGIFMSIFGNRNSCINNSPSSIPRVSRFVYLYRPIYDVE